jgi:hypothetical protein
LAWVPDAQLRVSVVTSHFIQPDGAWAASVVLADTTGSNATALVRDVSVHAAVIRCRFSVCELAPQSAVTQMHQSLYW